jgi:CRP/FNR family transcriptional regulator
MEPSLNSRVEWEAGELLTGEERAFPSQEQLDRQVLGQVPLTEQITYSLQSASFGVILRRIESLAGLPQAESDELAQISEFRRYPAGTQVFRQGERIPGIFLVIRGSLKITRSSGRGKVQVLAILQPGTCVGEVQVFNGSPIASGAEALGDTDCWLIPGEAVRELVRRNVIVREVIIRHFAGKVRHLIALVEALGLHSVPERVAQLILDHIHQGPEGNQVKFRETQEELAQRVGAGREAFSRSLRLLAGLGLIESTFPSIQVLDLEKLQRYARG